MTIVMTKVISHEYDLTDDLDLDRFTEYDWNSHSQSVSVTSRGQRVTSHSTVD